MKHKQKLYLFIGSGFLTMLVGFSTVIIVFAQSTGQNQQLFLPLVLSGSNQPQPDTNIPYHIQPYLFRSDHLSGSSAIADASSKPSFQKLISIAGAPWLRLHFGPSNLGTASYLLLTAVQDGNQQRIDTRSMAEWNNKSAFFNGDAVQVELFAAEADTNIFFAIEEIMVGEETDTSQEAETPIFPPLVASDVDSPLSICLPNDDRVASANPAVGRIMPIGCTAWIISNGLYLTAGHCAEEGGVFDPRMATLQFNVPQSATNGAIRNPPAEHQYAIAQNTVRWSAGEDWAVFSVSPTADTTGHRRLPPEAQDAFYRLSRDANPTTVTVTGYGTDGPGPCFGDRRQPGCSIPSPTPVPLNAANQTQQTHTGATISRTGNRWSYYVDTQGGNSGSPIIDTNASFRIAVGIHTTGMPTGSNAQCTTGSPGNSGTSFDYTGLRTAINLFWNINTDNRRYVDLLHPVTLEDGSVFRPYDTVNEGISQIPNGGTLSIVEGTYNESVTINRSMVLTAPVGIVTIIGQ